MKVEVLVAVVFVKSLLTMEDSSCNFSRECSHVNKMILVEEDIFCCTLDVQPHGTA